MKNTQKGFGIIIVLAVVAVLAIGGGVYYSSSKKSAENKQETSEVETTNSVKEGITLKSLLGRNVKCSVAKSEASGNSSGTVYISGENFRGDFSTTLSSGGVLESHMIKGSEYVYIWSSAMPNQGIKMKVNKEMEASGTTKSPVDWNEKLNYECNDTVIDQGLFKLPTTVNFIDFEAMMNGNKVDVNALMKSKGY